MRLRVVYLDDEVDLLAIFRETFEGPLIQISIFCNASEAIAAVRETPPDLVVLDYRLTNTTGDEVAQQMDDLIPKILMTGDLSVKTVSHFQHIFYKPYQIPDVRDCLQRAFEKKYKAAA